LEKTSKLIKSNRQPNTTMPTTTASGKGPPVAALAAQWPWSLQPAPRREWACLWVTPTELKVSEDTI